MPDVPLEDADTALGAAAAAAADDDMVGLQMRIYRIFAIGGR